MTKALQLDEDTAVFGPDMKFNRDVFSVLRTDRLTGEKVSFQIDLGTIRKIARFADEAVSQ